MEFIIVTIFYCLIKIKIVSLDTRYFKDDFILNQDRSLNKNIKLIIIKTKLFWVKNNGNG